MQGSKLTSLLKRSIGSQSQAVKKAVIEFAEESGMVYFGYVSQRGDDHHILRGMTVSTKHHDDHYCIGTYDGYDVVFVERSDVLGNGKSHVWHILEFDLKTNDDIPHVFIGSKNRGHGFHELLELKYPNVKPINLGATQTYPAQFTDSFGVYTTPAHAVTTEKLVTPDVANMMATHFGGLAVEMTDQALYVYSEKSHVSSELLEAMLKNGAWLAQKLDENSRQLV